MKRNRKWLLGLALLGLVLLSACKRENPAPAATIQSSEQGYLQELPEEVTEPAITAVEVEESGTSDTAVEESGTSTTAVEESGTSAAAVEESGTSAAEVEESGTYTSKEEVAEYLHLYGHLPDNYITKKDAQELGWDSSLGNLQKVAPGKSIGGDYFGNYEGLLPEKKGRKYYECDIDYAGGRRNAKRIIFSNDGLIFYTEDHYATFEQLY